MRYKLKFKKDEVTLLGTNGSMDNYNYCGDTEEVMSRFGVYYTLDPTPSVRFYTVTTKETIRRD